MNKILNIYKPPGLTPLQLIKRLREVHPEYKDVKIGYAGRLDPMARGVMLLMIGDATRERDQYLGLDKEYLFEVLFGFETDTYDLLGIVENEKIVNFEKQNFEKKLKQYCDEFPKSFNQVYPPYSSKAVNGKPLFEYSRENKLDEIVMPTKKVNIYNFEYLSSGDIEKNTLINLIKERVNQVNGDFRQDVILKTWFNVLNESINEKIVTARFRLSCSSGTYVRSLVHEMGTKFGSGAVAMDIFRTKVGTYNIDSSVKLKHSESRG